MMRNLLIFTLFSFTASGAAADTKTESFFDHRYWEVGTVPRGMTLHHYFSVTNTSDQPIHIVSIRVSCGCVSAYAVKKELAPGEKTLIVAQIESRQFTGVINKTIFVLLDQPALEEVRLQVQANVLPELTINPSGLKFGPIKKGTSAEKSLLVSLPDSRFGSLEKATCESKYVQVKVEPSSEYPGSQTYRVTAKLDPTLPVGSWYSTVWITGADRKQPPINIPMMVEVVP